MGGKGMTMKATKNDIGRIVIFRAITRWGAAKATRKIKGIRPNGGVIVTFGGWKDFYVRPGEIIEIFGEGT